MLLDHLQTGDKVKLQVAKDNREWGYNPGEDGTIVEIVDFSVIAHDDGIYLNKNWPLVRFPDGHTSTVGFHCLAPLDEEEYEAVVESHRDENRVYSPPKTKIMELPETEFVKGDRVTVGDLSQLRGEIGTVSRIDYVHLLAMRGEIDERFRSRRNDGSDFGVYDVQLDSGGSIMWQEEENLTLIERGPRWKERHGERPEFDSLEDEAAFEQQENRAHGVRNPADGLFYTWTLEQALRHILDGHAHGLTVGHHMFSGNPYTDVIRYDNEDVGRRVREATLAGFAETIKKMARVGDSAG